MAETIIKISTKGNNRRAIRENLILEFLKEEPGNNNETSIYYYYVDTTKDGTQIYLHRPAILNKGMDFGVHAENVIFYNKTRSGGVRRSSRPSHPTIIEDLSVKKVENKKEYAKVKELIDRIYNCENVSDKEILSLKFKTGFEIELILKIIKWLFIEQDITYWNWSGRFMFYSGIKGI